MDSERLHACGTERESQREQQLLYLEFENQDKLAHLVQSLFHPSRWFIVESAVSDHSWIPPFDHSLQSDEWTAQLHNHRILGYMGVYVEDRLIAGHRASTTRLSKP